jgi:pilus assembly protein Flp/PilA
MNDTRSNTALSSPRKPRLLDDTRGAGLVEYIVLVGLIALAAIWGFGEFGGAVNDKAIDLGERVEGIGN